MHIKKFKYTFLLRVFHIRYKHVSPYIQGCMCVIIIVTLYSSITLDVGACMSYIAFTYVQNYSPVNQLSYITKQISSYSHINRFSFPFIWDTFSVNVEKSKIAELGLPRNNPAGNSLEASLSPPYPPPSSSVVANPSYSAQTWAPLCFPYSLSHFLSLCSGPQVSPPDRKIKDYGTYHYSENWYTALNSMLMIYNVKSLQ